MSSTFIWRGAAVLASERKGAAKGLKEAADLLLKESQPLVPVSPYSMGGALRDSGKAEVDEGALRAAVSYQAPVANVATWVHERMDVAHDTGQAKFLEQPMNGHRDDFLKLIAGSIKESLGT